MTVNDIVEIENEQYLIDIALGEPNDELRNAAIDRINDMHDFPLVDVYEWRKWTYDESDEPSMDEYWYGSNHDYKNSPSIREKAVSRISNERMLITIACKDPSFDVRYAAISKITDKAFLKQMSTYDRVDDDMKKAARRRLNILTSPIDILCETEANEAMARTLRESEQKTAFNCESEFGEEKCHTCRNYDFCEVNEDIKENSIKELMDMAYENYMEILVLARKAVEKENSIENLQTLARVLMDIAIHVKTKDIRKSAELWEAQYIWLKLFYRTNKEEYLKKAKICDGFRHAFVEKVD